MPFGVVSDHKDGDAQRPGHFEPGLDLLATQRNVRTRAARRNVLTHAARSGLRLPSSPVELVGPPFTTRLHCRES